MVAINPDPASLGLASPQLGPWFSTTVNLDNPDPLDLSVAISSTIWKPPAGGTLSLIFPSSTKVGDETLLHSSLFRLRNVSGVPRFTEESGKLLALFTLLPEVVVRLRQLYLEVDRLGNRADNALRRDVPVQFALLFDAPGDKSTLGVMTGLDLDIVGVDALGLQGDGPFQNGPRPMAWLRRPGGIIPGSGENLIDLAGKPARLFAFDEFGLPLDPGAVAAAFQELLNSFNNLSVGGNLPTFNAGRRMHFVNPMGGVPAADIRGLVQQNGTPIPGTENLNDFTGELSLSFAANNLTNRPFIRIGLLPSGPYATTVSLAENRLMARDFVRIGLTDVEVLLAGSKRSDPTQAPRQASISTRINLARSTANPTLLPNQEAVHQAVQAILDGPDPAILVSGTVDGSAGPISPADLSDLRPPDEILSITLLSLQGGRGPDDPGNPDWAPAMLGVVQVDLDASLVGAWVHVSPLDFDLETSERKRLAGGGGRTILADGRARATVLLTLPPGDAEPNEDDVVAFDVEIVGSNAKRLIGTQQAPRPARPPETPGSLAVGADGSFPAGATGLFICETGQRVTPGGSLVLSSGLSVLAELSGGGFAKLDTLAAPFSVFSGGLGNRLRNGDTVVMTARVWKDDPPGDNVSRLSATGAQVLQATRDQLNTLDDPGAPLPLLERRDILISSLGDARADSVIAAVPLIDRYHELSPGRLGRADEPATSELHGTGARLSGPAGLLGAEVAADRRFAATPDLLNALTNNTPPTEPPDPGGPTPLVALLRTVAAGVEGEPQMHAADVLLDYPFSGSTVEKIAWLTGLGFTDLPLPANAAADQRFRRAADRRVMAATEGLSEAGDVAAKLIQQAERFIYVESSDLTALLSDADSDRLNLLQELRKRLIANPALHILVCLPFEPFHPHPGIKRYLTHLNQRAIDLFRGGDAPTGSFSPLIKNRFVVFASFAGARGTLSIASTTIIIDDVVAITGGFALSRRGLTFDSSLAVALFDERLLRERSQEVFQFRQKLIADRLGERVEDIPADGTIVAGMVREALKAGFNRNISLPKDPVGEDPGTGFDNAYDPDGRSAEGFNITDYVLALAVDTGLRDHLA